MQVVKDNNIECGFERRKGYLFPHDSTAEAMKIFNKEYEACLVCLVQKCCLECIGQLAHTYCTTLGACPLSSTQRCACPQQHELQQLCHVLSR